MKFYRIILILLLQIHCIPNANFNNPGDGSGGLVMKLFEIIALSGNTNKNQIGISVSNTPTSIPENKTVDIDITFSSAISADSTITVSSNNPGITVNGSNNAILAFTTSNATLSQKVTLKAEDDVNLVSEIGKITLSSPGSTDIIFDIATVDDDIQNISITGTTTLNEGSNGSISVSLTKQPSTDVIINLTPSDSNSLSVGFGTLTFTPTNYNIPQSVTITALQDSNQISESITITASSTGISSATWVVLCVEYIRGTISGVPGTLVLQNKGGDDLSVSANGSFIFNTPSTTYNITAKTYLYSKICTISGGKGTNTTVGANIVVTCSNKSYFLGGSALGLLSTNQTTSYFPGDDGTHQKMIKSNFTDNGNGTVTDNVTSLVWQKCTVGQANDSTCSGTAILMNWTAADQYCPGITLASQSWRLPTVQEISTLFNASVTSSPYIDTLFFPGTQTDNNYWSSTPYAISSTSAWYFNFLSVSVFRTSKANTNYVRCVSGPSSVTPSFTNNGNGTVTDNNTKLVWQRCSYGQNNDATCTGSISNTNWTNSLAYCNGLSLASRTWRLPNRYELQSIVSYTKTPAPTIDLTVFPNTPSSIVWSSTSNVYYDINSNLINNTAWSVLLSSGSVSETTKTSSSSTSVRCVSDP